MLELKIRRKKDSSIYWIAFFNSQNEMQQWLKLDEKTRPKTDGGYSYDVRDLTSELGKKKQQAEEFEKKKRDQGKAKLDELKALLDDDLSDAKIKKILRHLVELVEK